MPQAQTSARPLAWLYAALIVYASLYPFGPWRDQGIAPWSFVTAPPSPYWTGFDVGANFLGYVPLGFWVSVAFLRLGQTQGAWWRGLLVSAMLSFGLEAMQSYLPMRVPSQIDWLLNTLGGGVGAGLAQAMERCGVLLRYSAMRKRWFIVHTHGALPLLITWPLALLFPLTIPLGLGQVQERAHAALQPWLSGTALWQWWPLPHAWTPLTPATTAWCVCLGLWVPVLLAYTVIQHPGRRLLALFLLLVSAVGVTSLSVALSYGPLQAWSWLDDTATAGLLGGMVLGLVALVLPLRFCLVLLLPVAIWHWMLVNQAPPNSYFEETLRVWEQGRFIRFNGLAQWLGWLWPLALMADLMRRLLRP